MVRYNTCGIIDEYDTNNMAKNLISRKPEVMISYWQNRVAIAIHKKI